MKLGRPYEIHSSYTDKDFAELDKDMDAALDKFTNEFRASLKNLVELARSNGSIVAVQTENK